MCRMVGISLADLRRDAPRPAGCFGALAAKPRSTGPNGGHPAKKQSCRQSRRSHLVRMKDLGSFFEYRISPSVHA